MEHISTTDTAKRLRKVLKHYWPGTKFSVRSNYYAGGSSIDIRWTDGPRTKAVEQYTDAYEGASFDGMIDLKSYHSTIIVDKDGPREVRFGSDYVFCSRTVTDFAELKAQAEAMIRGRCQLDGDQFGGQWVDVLAMGMVYALDFDRATTLEDTFREIVLREREAVA